MTNKHTGVSSSTDNPPVPPKDGEKTTLYSHLPHFRGSQTTSSVCVVDLELGVAVADLCGLTRDEYVRIFAEFAVDPLVGLAGHGKVRA